jgi:1-deoxy-D-xylulose 5-phosphate reductoisomerase
MLIRAVLAHVKYLFWCVEKSLVQLQHIDMHTHITCCINCPTKESSVMMDCEFLLNSSLVFFTKPESYSPALITQCGSLDDGDSKNCSSACTVISVHLS